MQQHAAVPGDRGYFRHRLDRTDFAIGMHDADQDRAVGDRRAQHRRIDPAIPVDRQVGHRRAKGFEEFAGRQGRGMFDACRDDVAAGATAREEGALDRMIDAFRAAAGEDHLARRTAKQRRDLAARVFNRVAGRAAGPVQGGGVAIGTVEETANRLRHFRRQRCAAVVIEVDHAPSITMATRPMACRPSTIAIAAWKSSSGKTCATRGFSRSSSNHANSCAIISRIRSAY